MSDYPIGTVARATVRDCAGIQVMRIAHPDPSWVSAEPCNGFTVHSESRLTDIRPLVVLDMGDERHLAAKLAGLLRDTGYGDIADQNKAQTKPPPRIEEPGLWGVVEDCDGGKWVRIDGRNWLGDGGGSYIDWQNIPDPVLVREGLS